MSTSCCGAPTSRSTSPRSNTPARFATTRPRTTTTRPTSRSSPSCAGAIEADELVLHYQPKARFANGQFDAVEALVRWQHPVHGLLVPDKFLPLAEPTELIDSLTDWVLTRALTDMRDLHSRREIDVAVNVSARNFSRPDFADRVLRILQDVGVSPNRLTIEITETALLTDPGAPRSRSRSSTRSA